MHARTRRYFAALLAVLAGTAFCFVPDSAFAQEAAWVRGEIHLNVRSGPSTSNRIITGIDTGDALSVIERGDGWTKIRLSDGSEGWIPEGYLEPTPPPAIDLARLEEEAAQMRNDLARARSESSSLRDSNASMSSETMAQKSELDDLRVRLARLQAGQGHPEMIAGASILVVGVLIGIIVGRSMARRRSTRIRI